MNDSGGELSKYLLSGLIALVTVLAGRFFSRLEGGTKLSEDQKVDVAIQKTRLTALESELDDLKDRVRDLERKIVTLDRAASDRSHLLFYKIQEVAHEAEKRGWQVSADEWKLPDRVKETSDEE